jgi:hypothetical protein
MAINLVTAPTAGAPIDTNDYDAQNNYLQALLYWMQQSGRYLTEWDTSVKPEIADGTYIMHGGALYIVDGDEAITGSPLDGRVYVKLEAGAGDTLVAAFVNSASGYSWNDIYNGFYNSGGSQILPVFCYLNDISYIKYHVIALENKYDITSKFSKGKIAAGYIWTARSAAEASEWFSVCWSPELSLFCAVARSGTNRVMTSPDGTTWTARSAAEANIWRSVCWSPELSLFCAVALAGTNLVMTSPDGITWTARSAAEANQWRSVCWSPELSLFCAVAETGTNRVMRTL